MAYQEQGRLYNKLKETVQHHLAGCQKLAGTEYFKQHDNASKVIAVKWAVKRGILHQGTKR